MNYHLHTVCRSILFSLVLNATTAFGQNAPQFVARQDIAHEGSVIALAGDLINAVSADEKTVILPGPDGKQFKIPRSAVASMDDAIVVLDGLIRKEPQSVRLFSARASVWAAKGDFTGAVVDATKAIEVSDKKDAILYVNRGAFYSSAGQHDSAVADYVRATHVDPTEISAYTSLATVWITQKKYDKAIDVCTKVIKVDPDDDNHYVQRGVAYRFKEQWDAAIADFSKALELSPDNLAALGSRGFVNYLKGDHQAAVKDFDAIIRLTPDDPMAYNNRGYNRQLAGDYRNALTDFNKALELLPSYTMAWQNKAWLLATCPDDNVRNGEQALAAARKAIDQREERIAGDLKALAAAYAESGDFAKAIEHQTKVIELTAEEARELEKSILTTYQQNKPYRMQAAAKQSDGQI